MSVVARVAIIPPCYFCEDDTPAAYDAKTTMGPWAFLCQPHMDQFGPPQLGTGFGQLLILEASP